MGPTWYPICLGFRWWYKADLHNTRQILCKDTTHALDTHTLITIYACLFVPRIECVSLNRQSSAVHTAQWHMKFRSDIQPQQVDVYIAEAEWQDHYQGDHRMLPEEERWAWNTLFISHVEASRAPFYSYTLCCAAMKQFINFLLFLSGV